MSTPIVKVPSFSKRSGTNMEEGASEVNGVLVEGNSDEQKLPLGQEEKEEGDEQQGEQEEPERLEPTSEPTRSPVEEQGDIAASTSKQSKTGESNSGQDDDDTGSLSANSSPANSPAKTKKKAKKSKKKKKKRSLTNLLSFKVSSKQEKEAKSKNEAGKMPQLKHDDDEEGEASSTSTTTTVESEFGEKTEEKANTPKSKKGGILTSSKSDSSKKSRQGSPEKKVSFSPENQVHEGRQEDDLEIVDLESPSSNQIQYYGNEDHQSVGNKYNDLLVSVESLGGQDPVFQDWLRVMSDTSRSKGKWKNRWVLIHNNVLYIFASFDSSQPCCIVILDQVQLESECSDLELAGRCAGPLNVSNVFKLRDQTGRVLYLQADSENMKNQWMDLLNQKPRSNSSQNADESSSNNNCSGSGGSSSSINNNKKKKNNNGLSNKSDDQNESSNKNGAVVARSQRTVSPSTKQIGASTIFWSSFVVAQVAVQVSMEVAYFLSHGETRPE